MSLVAPGMPKTAGTALTGIKILNDVKFCPYHRHYDHLRDALARLDGKALSPRFQQDTNTWPW